MTEKLNHNERFKSDKKAWKKKQPKKKKLGCPGCGYTFKGSHCPHCGGE